VATFVENAPLRRIGLKPGPVSREVGKPEIVHAPLEPVANLAADLAESCPAQAELRQRPLQEGRAILVIHRALTLARLRLSPGGAGAGLAAASIAIVPRRPQRLLERGQPEATLRSPGQAPDAQAIIGQLLIEISAHRRFARLSAATVVRRQDWRSERRNVYGRGSAEAMNQFTGEAWRRGPQPSSPSIPEEIPVRRAGGAGPALSGGTTPSSVPQRKGSSRTRRKDRRTQRSGPAPGPAQSSVLRE
jgi:hypothetical protein